MKCRQIRGCVLAVVLAACLWAPCAGGEADGGLEEELWRVMPQLSADQYEVLRQMAGHSATAPREHGGRRLLQNGTTTPAPTPPPTQLPAQFDFLEWLPPELSAISSYRGRRYTVVLYHIPPFVTINDWAATTDNSDPGNILGTRTVAGGQLSGLTVDFLMDLESRLQVQFKFVYPCKSAEFAGGACKAPTKAHALAMVRGSASSAEYIGGGAGFCSDLRCFAAGAVKIDVPTLSDFFVTQPYMEKGFALVVREGPVQPGLFSWAEPFTQELWIVIVCELVLCALGFMWVEGYGTNEALWDMSNPAGQFLDSLYWAITLVLGAADKAPTTHAGRTLVSAQLVFGVLLIALYTGNLASFLSNIPTTTAVTRVQDLFDESSRYYSRDTSVCYSKNQASIKAWLDQQEASSLVQLVEREDFDDCVRAVYRGEATATLFDEPVAISTMKNFYNTGMCGNGGYCTAGKTGGPDPLTFQDKQACECPADDVLLDGACANYYDTEWTSIEGSLTTVGEVFNPFGYGFAFPKNITSTDYLGFSQAIQWIKDQGSLVALEAKYIPDVDSLTCSSSAGGGKVVLGFKNIRGLLIIVGIVVLVGLGLGMLETIIKIALICCPCLGKQGAAMIEALHEAEEALHEQQLHGAIGGRKHAEREQEEKEEEEDEIVEKGIQDIATRLKALETMLHGSNKESVTA